MQTSSLISFPPRQFFNSIKRPSIQSRRDLWEDAAVY